MDFLENFEIPEKYNEEVIYEGVAFDNIADDIAEIQIEKILSKYNVLDWGTEFYEYSWDNISTFGYKDILIVEPHTKRLRRFTIAHRENGNIYLGLYVVSHNPNKHPRIRKIRKDLL